MYITGAIGSTSTGEAFTFDYDLPNDTVYGETCASIGLVFLARRMLEIEPRGEYGDVMERCLYNGTISGMSLDGTKFFYVNPLESDPLLSRESVNHQHVKSERQKWFGCACCPPNLARLVTSVTGYAYTVSAETRTLYSHLYINGSASINVGDDTVCVKTTTAYPWDGAVRFDIKAGKPFTFAVRIPAWCSKFSVKLNGKEAETRLNDGYLYIDNVCEEAAIELALDMKPRLWRANTAVREDAGKVVLQRGPLVYCLEQEDNGAALYNLYLPSGTEFTEKFEKDLLGGVVTVSCCGSRQNDSGDALYFDDKEAAYTPCTLKFVPYYAWCNRTPGEMTVYVKKETGPLK